MKRLPRKEETIAAEQISLTGWKLKTPHANGAVVDAFAAGALLVMLTDSMIPESFEHGGKETGLCLVLGFGLAAAVSLMQLG